MSNEEPAAATMPASDNNPSESERIRQALVKAIQEGADFTDKKTRQRVGHAVAEQLTKDLGYEVPYGNVCKQFKSAMRAANEAAGLPPSEVSRTVGAGKTSFRIPPPAAPKEAMMPEGKPPQATDGGSPSPPAGQQTGQPPAENPILAKYKNIEELMQGPEYMRLYLTYYSMFNEVHSMYAMIGIPPVQDLVKIKVVGGDGKVHEKEIERTAMLAQQWALAHIKYNWEFPGWLEKAMLIAGTIIGLAMPPLVHFGIIDDIKGGFGRKKQNDDGKVQPPERSQNALDPDTAEKLR